MSNSLTIALDAMQSEEPASSGILQTGRTERTILGKAVRENSSVGKLLNRLLDVWLDLRLLRIASASKYDAIQVRDKILASLVGLLAAKLNGIPFFYWMSFPMSLVGPRPHALSTKAEGRLFEDVVDRYAARHKVKPGITGWAQVNGWRGETDTTEKIQKRVEYDLFYIDNWSVWLDLKILLLTLAVIFKDENAY